MKKNLIDEIDALLPQTQCGLCGYGGCRPYANALAFENENIDKCPPGGIETLQALASLLNKDAKPFLSDMAKKAKPPMLANIREEECIGCTKCIQACPVDAILGANKQMHTVIASECTGCELCVAPCPVDCIDMLVVPPNSEIVQRQKSNLARERFQFRTARLQNEKQEHASKHRRAKLADQSVKENIVSARKAAIEAAIHRVKNKSEKT